MRTSYSRHVVAERRQSSVVSRRAPFASLVVLVRLTVCCDPVSQVFARAWIAIPVFVWGWTCAIQEGGIGWLKESLRAEEFERERVCELGGYRLRVRVLSTRVSKWAGRECEYGVHWCSCVCVIGVWGLLLWVRVVVWSCMWCGVVFGMCLLCVISLLVWEGSPECQCRLVVRTWA